MSFLLALLAAQVGPFATPGTQPASPLPPEVVEHKERERQKNREKAKVTTPQQPAQQSATPLSARLATCLEAVDSDPTEASEAAEEWSGKAKGEEKAQAGQCLGMAYSRLERWDDAETAFLAARDAVPEGTPALRARLGAMAGNAALARGDAEIARSALDAAYADARTSGDVAMAGDISIDRARTLVALGHPDEAAGALAEARAALPGNAQAWLLSATLSRRMGKLTDAQQQIEKAAELLPVDPEIGLEAGRIAVLAGRDEAARKSWQSVIEAAPSSEAATQARAYLQQLSQIQAP